MRKVPAIQHLREGRWIELAVDQLIKASHVPTPGIEVQSPFLAVEVTKGFFLTGIISPAQITGDQNNYNPTDLANASVLRLTTDASRNITGLVPPTLDSRGGRVLIVANVGAQDIVLVDESGSSTEANRFALTGNYTLSPDESICLWYDPTSLRWRALS